MDFKIQIFLMLNMLMFVVGSEIKSLTIFVFPFINSDG